MRYIITTVDPIKNSGGNKAKADIDYFSSQLPNTGVIHLPVFSSRTLRFLLTSLTVRHQIKQYPADEYIIQYPPLTLFVAKTLISVIRKNRPKAKIYAIIHDLPSLQFGKDKQKDEFALLNKMDGLIVHNDSMLNLLKSNGVHTKMHILHLFDYDNPQPMQKRHKLTQSVCFPGNLSKSKFLQRLNLKHTVDIYGPNKLDSYPKCVKYCGQYTPEELPKHLYESFGLIWDGNSTHTCSGTFGEYLKFNNPHKASLYLSSGIPVIIWRQAALAKFVKENNVGILIDDLSKLDDVLYQINDDQYQLMKSNAEKVGQKLRQGYYIKSALRNLD